MAIIFHCHGIFIFHSSVDGHLVCLHLLAFMNNCCCSVTKLCPTLCDSVDCRLLSTTISSSLLRFMSIELVMLSNHLILCRPLLLLPSVFPSIKVFSHESTLGIKWPKYWSFSFSSSPSNEYSWLISFRIDNAAMKMCAHIFWGLRGLTSPFSSYKRLGHPQILVSSGILEQSPWGIDTLGGLYVFLWTYVFISPGTYLGVGLLDHMVILCLTFPGTARLFSKMAWLYFPIIGVWGLWLLRVLVNTYSSLSTAACTLEIYKRKVNKETRNCKLFVNCEGLRLICTEISEYHVPNTKYFGYRYLPIYVGESGLVLLALPQTHHWR